uniref:Uncharacterized protein n=1 Tax=Lepeophtheirus salmonis TaxID=72036 RepID=A0A0K2SYC5_LEPSM
MPILHWSFTFGYTITHVYDSCLTSTTLFNIDVIVDEWLDVLSKSVFLVQ